MDQLFPILMLLAGAALGYGAAVAVFRAERRAVDERGQMALHFEHLAQRIFEEKTARFEQQSHKSLSEMLAPIKERFHDFQKKIDDSFGAQAKEQFALKEEIKRIVQVNEKMTLQAESLTRALKGDVKAQGNWGEVMLEKILEESGLRRGVDYAVQAAGMKLRDAEGAAVQRPDVVVNLPEGKHVVIDAKVSLTAYERYCGAADEAARALHLRQFTESLRAHVTGLAAREYQHNEKLFTPDFVLMFVPVEGAYSLAVQSDAQLHSYAWDRKVVVVCPTTLFATLQTIASMWRIELRNQKAQDIAKRGGALYDKITGFVEDMQALGRQLSLAERAYQGAMGKLSQGNGNMLRQAEMLKDMGAKAGKQLPKELLEDEAEPLLEKTS